MLSDWLQKSTQRLLTPQCSLCKLNKSNSDRSSTFCNTCMEHFAPTPRCLRCGLETPSTIEQCGSCLSHPPLWDRLYCVSDYTFPTSSYIHKFKYTKQFWLARDLASLISSRIDQPAPLITSVPLHWRRYLQRGFNQSDLLARYTAKALTTKEVKVESKTLFKRTRATKTQQGLSKHLRKQNLADAFELIKADVPKHVAIMDDVVTTGSTVNHLCQLLREMGVERIDIYCICRTPEPSK
ncbi:ComF family protein [Vibrio sp. 99-70-13A1]|uniref:ComF family protein n=1 Tax=Vibrio sp. 99-70-13A1 TaxID=2607601 RepID=UPI001493A50B|nr:ComF family protein [Vibrio sp. 99-70-13A1]NOH96141.1 ComF family protein [Vibrio sp. 99-70-13A1]